MHKKYWIITATVFVFIALVFGLVFLWFWIYGDKVFKEDVDPTLYVTIGENGNWFVGDSDTGIMARGDDGFTPYIGYNGNWWIGEHDTNCKARAKDGIDGKDGLDGQTPYIAENGNWWIGETDLGIKAEAIDGTDGKNGVDGEDGKNGIDGLTPFIGENGNWHIGELDTGIKAEGKDGANGVNGENGIDGIDGIDGVDGIDGKTPFIAENGNWWIGETDTGVKAEGIDGANGTNGVDGINGLDGLTPHIGENGNWWIGEEDTGVSAAGASGANGKDGAAGKDGEDGNGIAEMKISDGCLYVRYTNEPAKWVNLGKIANIENYSLQYYPLPDGTYAVGAGALLYSEEIKIPSEFNGKKVSAIVREGFSGAVNLKSITLPDTLTEIGESAFFGAKRLEEIVIPESVAKIGANAFLSCESLTVKAVAAAIPSGWSEYFNPSGCAVILGYDPDANTFGYLKYEENAYGNIVITEYIGNEMYVTIPDTIGGKEVTAIASGAFANNCTIIRITLPKNLKEIKEGAFVNCPKLLEVYNLSDFLTVTLGASGNGGVAERAIAVHTASGAATVLKESGDFVFAEIEGVSYLVAYSNSETSVVLPESYNGGNYKVHAYALYGNSTVTTITVSKGVAEIGERAFANCENVTKIIFDAGECSALTSDTNAFEGSCTDAVVTIGKNVRSIPAYLFASNDASLSPSIVSVSFEEALTCTSISAYAFYNLTSLRVLILSQNVTHIDMGAFVGSGLTNVSGISGDWSDGATLYSYNTSQFVAVLKIPNKSFMRIGG